MISLADRVDPVERAQAAARRRFSSKLLAAARAVEGLLNGRSPRDLAGAEAVRFLVLLARYGDVSARQRRFAEAELAMMRKPN